MAKYNYDQAAKYLIQNGANSKIARFTEKAIYDLMQYPEEKRNYQNFMTLKTTINKIMKTSGYHLTKATTDKLYKVEPYTSVADKTITEQIKEKRKLEAAVRLEGDKAPKVDRLEMEELVREVGKNPMNISMFNMILKPTGWKVEMRLELVKISDE